MCEQKKFRFGDRVRLLVAVEHDDLLRFHYPGEEAVFEGRAGDRVRCRLDADTVEVNIDEIVPMGD